MKLVLSGSPLSGLAFQVERSHDRELLVSVMRSKILSFCNEHNLGEMRDLFRTLPLHIHTDLNEEVVYVCTCE